MSANIATPSSAVLICGALAIVALVNAKEIHRPPFDAHNFRQCQTLSTIETFYEQGIDVLRPRTNYKGEPGVFVLEFPIFQAICAILYHLFGNSIVIIRAFNISLTVVTAGFVWLIGRRLFADDAAPSASLIYLSAPLNLTYMSAVLLDPLAVLIAMSIFYFVLKQIQRPIRRPVSYAAIGALACLLAVVKALYLFPTLVLLVVDVWRNRHSGYRLIALWSLCFLPACICFLLWNQYAQHVNNESFFTGGTDPAAHLGFSSLLSPQWYKVIGKRFLAQCVGPVGGLVVASMWIYALLQICRRTSSHHQISQGILALCVIGYWIGFANINFPHEYYSLVVVPFLAIAAAGAIASISNRSVSVIASIIVATASLFFFFAHRGFSQDKGALLLQRRLGENLPRSSYALVFLSSSQYPDLAPLHDFPAALYALGIRGTAKIVRSENDALQVWQNYPPHYNHLRYVVFLGMPPLPQVLHATTVRIWDDANELYVLEVIDWNVSRTPLQSVVPRVEPPYAASRLSIFPQERPIRTDGIENEQVYRSIAR
ncbi:MAG: hypothetical protein QOG48_304 [Verrucomicrobiota bacterium]|jgi:4-amino-4-deoxy-L-arabinose transferase-like glycosyltransferase